MGGSRRTRRGTEAQGGEEEAEVEDTSSVEEGQDGEVNDMEADNDEVGCAESDGDEEQTDAMEDDDEGGVDVEGSDEGEASEDDEGEDEMGEGSESPEDEDDSDDDAASRRRPAASNEPTQRSLSNAMAKILGREVDGEGPVLSLNKAVVDKVDNALEAERAAVLASKNKRKLKISSHSHRPDKTSVAERRFKALATKGVVHLFNAIIKAQKNRDDEPAPIPAPAAQAAGEEKSKKGGWNVLSDEYMMDPKMKDWDAPGADDAGIASDDD